jgi:anti-sigma factor ChrR (cupin superfamily)
MTPADAEVLQDLITYLDTDAMAWEPLIAGARRKTLHSSESGRRIQLVQWDAGFALPYREEHGHDEFLLIVEGDFVDQNRSCGPGTFVHNRPGSWHQPHTTTGCIFLAVICPPAER